MENKPKQTAVEWLVEQLGENGFISTFESIKRDELQSIIEKAKEMEKQQIMLAYCLGHVFHDSNDENAAEFYYNTEYGKTSNN